MEVAVTSDGDFVFFSQEDGLPRTNDCGAVEVFKLHKTTSKGIVSVKFIGS
jgi:hypothetical protein